MMRVLTMTEGEAARVPVVMDEPNVKVKTVGGWLSFAVVHHFNYLFG